jgi:hypothetical protein
VLPYRGGDRTSTSSRPAASTSRPAWPVGGQAVFPFNPHKARLCASS